MKNNMNRSGYLRNFYMRDARCELRSAVAVVLRVAAKLADQPKTVDTAAGAIVTLDYDYTPIGDNVRTRPPEVSNINISKIKVRNVTKDGRTASCFQAIGILVPVVSDYNGAGR